MPNPPAAGSPAPTAPAAGPPSRPKQPPRDERQAELFEPEPAVTRGKGTGPEPPAEESEISAAAAVPTSTPDDLLIGATRGTMRGPLVAHGRSQGPREEAKPA